MKKNFIIPVTVQAYSRQEAEAKINLLLQGGAFFKDFNVQNIAGAIIGHFVWAKLGECAAKLHLEKQSTERSDNRKKESVPTTNWLKPVDFNTTK